MVSGGGGPDDWTSGPSLETLRFFEATGFLAAAAMFLAVMRSLRVGGGLEGRERGPLALIVSEVEGRMKGLVKRGRSKKL